MSDNYNASPATMMGPVEAIKTCFNKYCDFSGRASRAEYWWWFLFNIILSWVLGLFGPSSEQIIDVAANGGSALEILSAYSPVYLGINSLVSLALLLPSLAVAARRLHDIGCSAWWLLIYFTCVGALALLIMFIIPSQKYDNKYGPVPGTIYEDNDRF